MKVGNDPVVSALMRWDVIVGGSARNVNSFDCVGLDDNKE